MKTQDIFERLLKGEIIPADDAQAFKMREASFATKALLLKMNNSSNPSEIRKLLSEITGDVSKNTDKKICNYITKYMSSLLNNRLGTNLLETEHKFINNSETTDFKKGQMIVNEVSADTYKFVVYIENVDGNVKILTKDSASGGIIESQAHRSTLKHYSKHEQITQNMKDGMTFNETDLLEIYAC